MDPWRLAVVQLSHQRRQIENPFSASRCAVDEDADAEDRFDVVPVDDVPSLAFTGVVSVGAGAAGRWSSRGTEL
jgi:hypothetical protein